jgi:3-oxoacyl-[acyl-carrier protein] reductase
MGRLDDRVIIVTGGALGIGRAYCEGFAREGAKVVIADIDGPAAIRAAAELAEGGADALAITTDVADQASTEEMARATLKRFGRIDGLVNNAAIAIRLPKIEGPIEEITVEDWDRVMGVNLRGTFLCCRAVIGHMKERKYGKIINISSSTFFSGGGGNNAQYVASKGGVIAFTRVLAREVGDWNITVNSIAPGLTASETENTPMERYEVRVPHRAIKRIEQPEDLVGAAIFLISAESDFMSGQTMAVDGGHVMH